MIFVNTTNPNFRVYIPDSGEYAQFVGGKIELDEEDPGFAEVKAEAERNPAVAILVNTTTCDLCGQVFTGKAAKAQLGAHVKANHPDVWVAQKELEHATSMAKLAKSTEGFACDVCQPVQTFGTAQDLSAHVKLLHTQPPKMDDEGNETGGDPDQGRRPGERAIPAATASKK